MPSFTNSWISAFFEVLAAPEVAEPLKAAALDERLSEWTRLLTTAVVGACARSRWVAAAKGHPLCLLPKVGQEYPRSRCHGVLSILRLVQRWLKARTWPMTSGRWAMPVAVFELENSRDDDRVAYPLVESAGLGPGSSSSGVCLSG